MQPGGKAAVAAIATAAGALDLDLEGGRVEFCPILVPAERPPCAQSQDHASGAPVQQDLRLIVVVVQAGQGQRLFLRRDEIVGTGQQGFNLGQVSGGRGKDVQRGDDAAPPGLCHHLAGAAAVVHPVHQANAADMQDPGIQHAVDLGIVTNAAHGLTF